MDGLVEGGREQLPAEAAPLVDLAAKWMRDEGLVGPLENATLEFVLDERGRVRTWFAKSRGGRGDLLATTTP